MRSDYFKNKVSIITGSSQGIGKAIAVELINSGASVVLNGRNKETLDATVKELREMSDTVASFCGDISNPLEAQRLVNVALDEFGQLDILINNAGVSMRGKISELSPEVFSSVFKTNVFGSSNMTIAALPYIKKEQGSIIFISSVAGIRGLPGLSAYCSSKMALRAIAESLRIEEAKSNIHIGLIYVGYTLIDHQKKAISADGSLISLKSRSNQKAQTPESVAKSTLTNIRKRKFITTLSFIGKLNGFMQSLLPGLVENILIRNQDKIKEKGH
jgi:short-subunit dehydrogenase